MNQHYRSLYKKELAGYANVSPKTLRRWLNQLYFNEISPLGYVKTEPVLTPVVVKYLCEKLCIEISD